MPVICRFYGIVIRMYFAQKEHNPPHIHVIYESDVAVIKIVDCSILEGELPPKALSLAIEWVKKNKEELLKMWETQNFVQLEPLK